ncbi:uncharacterized protein LOC122856254 [Aphidius gifuensis]|uniref:uncharacterized protein LOC122856254 n=1 Tax=Aphidius gifuensis TaxID=684658 RepID=UPI001CDC5002|nr:uncharacterized protein LOC122856254 [Aphidius gifuensis]
MSNIESPTRPKNKDDNFLSSHREQYIFLFEFFIYKITGKRLSKLNEMFFVPTTVTLNLLNINFDDKIDITPVDPMFEPLAGIPGDFETFYTGKSIIFAIPQRIVDDKNTKFKINISVKKKMPDDIRPDIFVGHGTLDLSNEFDKLREENLQCWNQDNLLSKIYEGIVDLNYENKPIGIAEVFARISSFGPSIITELDSSSINKSTHIFKSDEIDGKNLSYKCRIIDPTEINICRESNDNLTSTKNNCHPCGEINGAVVKKNSPTIVQNDNYTKFNNNEKKIIQTSRGYSQAPPCGKAVVLKVSGLIDDDGNKKPTVTVDSRLSEPDPEYDIFVLRIGKKGLVGPDEKSDIQLEMKTPKGPDRRPPIRYETRDMQTDEEIIPIIEKKSKKKNNKKKKKK